MIRLNFGIHVYSQSQHEVCEGEGGVCCLVTNPDTERIKMKCIHFELRSLILPTSGVPEPGGVVVSGLLTLY